MPDDFVDSKGPKVATARMIGTAPIEEEFSEGSYGKPVTGGREETFSERREVRPLSEGILSKIEEAEKRGRPVVAAPVVETVTDAPVVADAPAPAADAARPVVAAPVIAPIPDDVTALKAERDRFEQANRALIAEMETVKAKPAPVPHKMLSEASESYLEDTTLSLRKFLAASLGIEDPADKRVTDELKDLYQDLTAAELGVTTDTAHQAKRDAARAIQLLAREKRERKAEVVKPAETQAPDTAAFIGNRLSAQRSDGKSLADSYPLLVKFSQTLDRLPPEKLLAKVLAHETKTGRIAVTADDDAMIAAAATLVENHYQALADEFGKAKPPSTAQQPTPPTTTSASKDASQHKAARNLTTADASVAPATTPAPKIDATTEKRPKFKTDKERREWALRHITS